MIEPHHRTPTQPGSVNADLQARFTRALDTLVEEVKADRSILAALLCGSLSHDTVWARSDIDLVLVTIDDRNLQAGGHALYVDGLNVHASLMSRTAFRQAVEGSLRSSFIHSLLAKGRLLYTHDPTIGDLCSSLHDPIGTRDTALQLLRAATGALPMLYKAHKWFITRRDLEYAALYLLETASALAQVEVVSARLLLEREVLQQALRLNPAFFTVVYTDLLNTRKTEQNVQAALDAADAYLATRAAVLFAPVIDHLQEVGENRSCTEIEYHFQKEHNMSGVTTACEYLADLGLIGKASTPLRLTKKSNIAVQELAFFHLSTVPDGGGTGNAAS